MKVAKAITHDEEDVTGAILVLKEDSQLKIMGERQRLSRIL